MEVLYCSVFICVVFFFKQKTAYEMRISDWSSDVCSSALTTKSSVADIAFENDIEALLAARDFIDFLPASNRAELPERPTADPWDRIEPSLDTLIPPSANQPYDMHETVRKVLDEGEFFEVQPAHAGNILIGFGRIEGRTVGVVANQPMVLAGCLDINSSKKDRKSTRLNSSH